MYRERQNERQHRHRALKRLAKQAENPGGKRHKVSSCRIVTQHSHIPADYMLTMQFAFVTPLKMQAFHMLQNAKEYAKNSMTNYRSTGFEYLLLKNN
jgi:hypothetical protein